MKKILWFIGILVVIICTGFIIMSGEGFTHNEAYDRDACHSCHTEFEEPFDSTPLPEVVKWRGKIAVVINKEGNVCTLSGIGWTGVAPCDELQYPRNYFYGIQTG